MVIIFREERLGKDLKDVYRGFFNNIDNVLCIQLDKMYVYVFVDDYFLFCI